MFNFLRGKDKVLIKFLKGEVARQRRVINLVASENIAPREVLKFLGSPLTNKYSEGYPSKRYYPGNFYYDKIEELTQKRALSIFNLKPSDWSVNVQPYSGAIANLAVFLALLKPGDTILSMDLASGGHLSHGSKVSFSGKLFKAVQYGVNQNYEIDYKEVEKLAQKYKPQIIISGASAYPKKINFKKFGLIAKKVGAYHLADISHYAGLISAGLYPSPFGFSDVVMTTTHKSLFGPRAALLYVSKKSLVAQKNGLDLVKAIDKAVFPGLQGGPHQNTIAAIAAGLFLTKKNKKYFRQVLKNSLTLCEEMKKLGFEIVGGGTESHLFLVDVRKIGLDGLEAEKMLEKENILVNRNLIAKDTSPLRPSAIRLGTYWVTAKGLKEKEMKKIAQQIYRILVLKRKHD